MYMCITCIKHIMFIMCAVIDICRDYVYKSYTCNLVIHTWCLILSLVSFWSSPLCDMSVCPLLTSATAVFGISC